MTNTNINSNTTITAIEKLIAARDAAKAASDALYEAVPPQWEGWDENACLRNMFGASRAEWEAALAARSADRAAREAREARAEAARHDLASATRKLHDAAAAAEAAGIACSVTGRHLSFSHNRIIAEMIQRSVDGVLSADDEDFVRVLIAAGAINPMVHDVTDETVVPVGGFHSFGSGSFGATSVASAGVVLGSGKAGADNGFGGYYYAPVKEAPSGAIVLSHKYSAPGGAEYSIHVLR